MSSLSILEIAENAKINFDNLKKFNPALGKHPMFIIAMEQLKEAIKMLEKQENENG